MPALVDQMFSVREMVWWQGTSEDKGQAKILGDHPPWPKARKLAGLDWDAISEPVFEWAGISTEQLTKQFGEILVAARSGDVDLNTATTQLMEAHGATFRQIEKWQKIARDDKPIGTPGRTLSLNPDSYEIISHSAFGEIFEGVLQQTNVKFETGGSLDGGRKVWMLVKLDEPVLVSARGRKDKSVTMPYMPLMSDHTGKGSTALRLTSVRIVCGNTFAAAELEGERSGRVFQFQHRGDWRSRLGEARAAVMDARNEMRRYEELGGHLLGIKVTKAQTELFVTQFAPMPPEGLITPQKARNVEAIRSGLRDLLNGPTVAEAGIGGTVFGLVQGAGEWLDHTRAAQSWGRRLSRSLLKPEPLKAEAMRLALEVAKS